MQVASLFLGAAREDIHEKKFLRRGKMSARQLQRALQENSQETNEEAQEELPMSVPSNTDGNPFALVGNLRFLEIQES